MTSHIVLSPHQEAMTTLVWLIGILLLLIDSTSSTPTMADAEIMTEATVDPPVTLVTTTGGLLWKNISSSTTTTSKPRCFIHVQDLFPMAMSVLFWDLAVVGNRPCWLPWQDEQFQPTYQLQHYYLVLELKVKHFATRILIMRGLQKRCLGHHLVENL